MTAAAWEEEDRRKAVSARRTEAPTPGEPAIEAEHVSRSFGRKRVLEDVSLRVAPGQVGALLGPNGAGKTTLLRILSGLTAPDAGAVRVAGLDPIADGRLVRRHVGLVPSGDRTFYLRLSGLENLVFFARLHGMRRRRALERAREVLEQVDLVDAAKAPVRTYSHGMQKRLSVARALLTKPSVFLVDEATHDLDPAAARNVMDIIKRFCDDGAAVIWATQRIDEIRGFADGVTLLALGAVRFSGTVPELMAHAVPQHYVLRLRDRLGRDDLEERALRALDAWGTIGPAEGSMTGHYKMRLAEDAVLGDALAALTAVEIEVLACREERSEVEQAFLSLMPQEDS